MSNPKEYVITGALMQCSEGTVPMPFKAAPRTTKIAGLQAGNELDKAPLLNIPSFVICKKLTQMAGGTPAPCVPAPAAWQDTYQAKVGGGKALLKKSCIQCTAGQGKIGFLTSGQAPLPPEAVEEMQEAEKEGKEVLEAAEKEKNAVGEAGMAEGLIPIWGSGRDLVHSIQTGNGWGVALNAGFLLWDVASVVAGVFSFGTATAAMMAGKAGVRTALKAAGKVVASAAKKQAGELMAKTAQMGKGIAKLGKSFASRIPSICFSKACFAAGTPVAVKGGYKNIEDIEVGDLVWAWDEATGDIGLKPVTATARKQTHALVELRFMQDRVRASPEHPFWTGGGHAQGQWREAGGLAEKETVWLLDKREAPLLEVSHHTEQETYEVFNFEVADWHTYFVGFWMALVHNANICLRSLKEIFLSRRYLREIEKITGRKLHPKQLKKLAAAVRHRHYFRYNKKGAAISRKKFNKARKKLIRKWEKETGQKWPKCKKQVINKKTGNFEWRTVDYDAHHIIANSHGGNAKWWNIHPARSPDQHQQLIHKAGSFFEQIFGK